MGVIRKLYANRNVGVDSNNSNLPTEGTEVYPVTSAKAVFLNNNITGLFASNQQTKELESVLNKLYDGIKSLAEQANALDETVADIKAFVGMTNSGDDDDTTE